LSDWLELKNALNLTFRPVDEWPGKLRYSRARAPYSAPLKDTITVLKRELRMLNAKHIVLQIAIRESDLRLDGLPRAGAVATHPGVILSFETADGPKMRAFDLFTKWEYNLRALALNLEHLRLANLYGVEERNQQYVGWKVLPAGTGNAAPDEAEKAATLLCSATGQIFTPTHVQAVKTDAVQLRRVYEAAVQRVHPDAGGDNQTMADVNRAYALLKQRMG
jgi:hypothetical protein